MPKVEDDRFTGKSAKRSDDGTVANLPKEEEKDIAEKSAKSPDVPEVEEKAVAEKSAIAPDVPEVAESGFIEKSIKPKTRADVPANVPEDETPCFTGKPAKHDGVVDGSCFGEKSPKQLGGVPKVEEKDIIENSIKSPDVPKVEEKDIMEKSIKSPKSKTNPGKPVTQETVAEAANVPEVEEKASAEKSALAPDVPKEEGKTFVGKMAPNVPVNLPEVEAPCFVEKSTKHDGADEAPCFIEKSIKHDGGMETPKGNKRAAKPVTQATVAKAVGVHRGVATG